jgi:uncharacterized membrane protein YdbT with pleckstrin-like domain
MHSVEIGGIMASYVEQVLGRDEELVGTAKITAWVWFWPVVLTVITVGVLFPILLSPLIRRRTTELGVTNKRVIAKSGLISRRTIEQRIQKIESIRVNQGIVGRLLDYGTIMIHGTGGATTPIPSVASPLAFKRAVEGVIDHYEQATPVMERLRR